MSWIKNCKDKKPDIDERYEEEQYSVSVLIHLKIGPTFIGFWDYKNEIWYADGMKIDDDRVMFWCRIPKLPKIIGKK